MKVYVAMAGEPWEAPDALAVFSDYAKAEAWAEERRGPSLPKGLGERWAAVEDCLVDDES